MCPTGTEGKKGRSGVGARRTIGIAEQLTPCVKDDVWLRDRPTLPAGPLPVRFRNPGKKIPLPSFDRAVSCFNYVPTFFSANE